MKPVIVVFVLISRHFKLNKTALEKTFNQRSQTVLGRIENVAENGICYCRLLHFSLLAVYLPKHNSRRHDKTYFSRECQ